MLEQNSSYLVTLQGQFSQMLLNMEIIATKKEKEHGINKTTSATFFEIALTSVGFYKKIIRCPMQEMQSPKLNNTDKKLTSIKATFKMM